MKKIITIFLTGIMLILSTGCMYAADLSDFAMEVSPCYLESDDIVPSMTGNTCKLTVNGESSVTKITATLTLYKKVNGSYVKQESWSGATTGNTLKMSKSYTASSGKTYKLVAIVKCYYGSTCETVKKSKVFTF